MKAKKVAASAAPTQPALVVLNHSGFIGYRRVRPLHACRRSCSGATKRDLPICPFRLLKVYKNAVETSKVDIVD